jgi:hypothetical protein
MPLKHVAKLNFIRNSSVGLQFKLVEASPYSHTHFSGFILILCSHLLLGLQMVSTFQVFQPKFLYIFSYLPCLLKALFCSNSHLPVFILIKSEEYKLLSSLFRFSVLLLPPFSIPPLDTLQTLLWNIKYHIPEK